MGFVLLDFLERRAELSPSSIAAEDLMTGEKLSYLELHQRTARTASLLLQLNLRPGDRLAILCRNRIEFFELLFACARIGAIAVPLNWRMPAQELDLLLEDSGARILLYGKEETEIAGSLKADGISVLPIDNPDVFAFAAKRDALPPFQPVIDWQAEQCWYLLYTSGTTGKPKAVIQTFGMAMANYINISQAMGLRSSDSSLCFLPLFHTGGINLIALPQLIMGGKVLFTPGFDVDLTVELIAQGRLDTFFAVPAVYQAISMHPKFENLDLSGVRCWACGGAPISDDMLKRYLARGAVVLNGMGMTETGPTVFLMDPDHAVQKIGSVGKPQILCKVRLVNSDGQDVQQGEVGELWFSGPGITPGYYRNSAATLEALPDSTWLRSGDLGRQDQDGYFYIVGRLKDMYISGGENVYSAEVENQLASYPAILEAAVIGAADEKWGEVGHAFILLRPQQEPPSPDELKRYMRSKLAAYKVPKLYTVVDEFPRTAAGKIQKHLLEAAEHING